MMAASECEELVRREETSEPHPGLWSYLAYEFPGL